MRAYHVILLHVIPMVISAQAAPPVTAVPPAFAAFAEADTVPHRYFPPDDPKAAALGLTPLRRLKLPEGSAEIRIWHGWGIIAGGDLVRLFRDGDQVEGTAAWHWPLDPKSVWTSIDATYRYQRSGQCKPFTRTGRLEGCEVRLIRRPGWEALWDTLTKLSIWMLPDQSSLPSDGRGILDGWGMVVEVRSGSHYRSYSYNNPDAYKRPEDSLATKIMAAASAVWDLVPPSDHTHTYRGRLSVRARRGATFVACGSTDRWRTDGNLDSLWYHSPPSDTTTIKSFYVVLQGMLSQPNPRIKRGMPSGRGLEVDTVNSATAWTRKNCLRESR
ncbi:MAG: hypothetical protein V4558_12645 [Gemmatimonadota bacterium]